MREEAWCEVSDEQVPASKNKSPASMLEPLGNDRMTSFRALTGSGPSEVRRLDGCDSSRKYRKRMGSIVRNERVMELLVLPLTS